MKEMIKMVVVLTILACASGGLLAKLHDVTKEPIAQQVLELVTAPVLRTMFEGASNDPITDRFTVTEGDQEVDVFMAAYDGTPDDQDV